MNLNSRTGGVQVLNQELASLWEQRFAQFDTSGQTVAAWCKEQSLRENQFYYWRRKLRSGQDKEQPVKWLAVNLGQGQQPRITADAIRLTVGQVTVQVRPGFDQDLLREIIGVLTSL